VPQYDLALGMRGLKVRRLPRPADGFPMWLVDVEQCDAEVVEGLLSSEELAAANRFRFHALRHRYILAHGVLRLLFRDRYGLSAKDQDIGKNRFGKPHLIRFPQIQYNMSYSANYVMIGVNEGDPIGVDIEVFRVIEDAAELMDLHFTEAERSAILQSASQGTCRSREFLKIWVRKEACVKASGRGLDIPLKNLECVFEGQMTSVQLDGGSYRTGALRLGDPIMAWSRRTSL